MVKAKDEFEKMDEEAGVKTTLTLPAIAVGQVNQSSEPFLPEVPKDISALRDNLVSRYHKGSPTLAAKLQGEGKSNIQELVMALVEEVVKETDHLLGNELVAMHEGSLRDASVISFKRAEVLEKAIKAVQAKLEFEKEGGIDVNSPSLMVVFRYMMSKVKIVFQLLGYDEEASDTFFRILSDEMGEWKKELKKEFDELNSIKG